MKVITTAKIMQPLFEIQSVNKQDALESMGTKSKFWHTYLQQRTLFKMGRLHTGENWAEKVACELAQMMGLPHAKYELAESQGTQGVNSVSFLPEEHDLIQGNVLLLDKIPDYPSGGSFYGLKEYQLHIVLDFLAHSDIYLPLNYSGNAIIKRAIDVFYGYLIFDCWIANQDRHHENWGIIYDKQNNQRYLAPTYDHASSLGCRVLEAECSERLVTRDRYRTLAHFVTKARSPFFGITGKKMSTYQCVQALMHKNPQVCCYWIQCLKKIDVNEIQQIFEKIPPAWITIPNKYFAIEVLQENKKRLAELC